jgi:putative ABC transport system substrate-binding protein
MRRREFIAGLGAAAWPVVARGQQQTALPVIGFLHIGSVNATRHVLSTFKRGLADAGYVEGRNVTIEYRWAEDHLERLSHLADDLVRRQVAVIVVIDTPPTLAAKAATRSIPIGFAIGIDPVEAGLVASLKRPGGNLTGIFTFNATLSAKRLELLHELLPTATTIAYLGNSASPIYGNIEKSGLEVASSTLGIRLLNLGVSHEGEFEAAFEALAQERVGAVFVSSDALFRLHADQVVALATHHQLPAMYAFREQAAIGGLMSYGTDFVAMRYLLGLYAGRLLKGEPPADLPVQQVTKMELVVNLKTAKALGLTVPQSILLSADEVVE